MSSLQTSTLNPEDYKKQKVIGPTGKVSILNAHKRLQATEKKAFAALVTMLCTASGKDSLGDAEITLLKEALDRQRITFHEAMNAFWEAYGDPYVKDGNIQFRHLWKHVKEKRSKPTPTYLNTRL